MSAPRYHATPAGAIVDALAKAPDQVRVCLCRDTATAERVSEALNLRAAALELQRTGDGHHRFAALCELLTPEPA